MSLWNKLSNLGIDPKTDIRTGKKIMITNQIALALSVIATCYIFIFCLVGFVAQGLWLILPAAFLLLAVYLNHTHYHILSKLLVYFTVVVTVYIYATMFGKATGIHLVFIPCACLPWIYFEVKQWKYILACTIISLGCFFFYHFSSGMPRVPITTFAETAICVCIITTVFAYIFLCMRFLSVQNDKAELFLVNTYQQFFEDIPTPMWIFDVHTQRFLAVNQNAIESYGYCKEEFLSMTLEDVHPSGQKAENEMAIQNKIRHEGAYDGGYVKHRKKNGKIFYAHVLTNSTIFNGVKARVVQAINVNDKVLTEKKLEDLRISQEQLKAREEELEETIKQKNAINKQLERFTSIVAHDIKSPLNGVMSMLGALKRDELIKGNEDLSYTVHGLIHSCTRQAEMVDSILEYSKRSQQEQDDEHVDVNELVVEIADILAPPKQINIRVEGTLPELRTKKLKLQQVFQNLLSNAIKYNDKEQGEIVIGHEDAGAFYRFFVKDNGQGIKEKDTERVFYLFQTTENESKNGDSKTGVGLNILKMLVEEQGGEVSVESEPTVGSCFYFQWRK